MHKPILTVFVLLSMFTKTSAQTPFTTLVKEPRFLSKTPEGKRIGLTKNDILKITNFQNLAIASDELNVIEQSQKNNFDFFKNSAFSLSILHRGENRASVNAEVLYYKLYIANPTEDNKLRLNRYNLPLMLVSKLSTNYDSTSGSTALDALDYEAAPITLRLMPSFKTPFTNYNDVFYFGFYADLRGINMQSPKAGTNNIELVGSGGIGLTYQGDGKAGSYNVNGEYEAGRYSVSVMLQAASGKQEVISKLFATDKNIVTAFQAYFVFKISDKNRLNLKAGYQYLFQKTIGGINNSFSIALGM